MRQIEKTFPTAKLKHRWSGQVLETVDGLPYIGQVAECQFLATGFSGNGMTLDAFSAMLIRDLITGQSSPWAEFFAPNRKSFSGTLDYLLENKDFLTYFIKDRLRTVDQREKLKRCSGEIMSLDIKSEQYIAMSTENAPCFQQSALIWAVSWPGMMLKEPGTALVMAPVSLP